MARYIRFNPDQYGVNGLIPLTIDDDWNLLGQVLDYDNGIPYELNLLDITGASAFFPCASGGFYSGIFTMTDVNYGRFNINMPASGTQFAEISLTGIQPYITLQGASGLQTIYPIDQSLQILSRGFQQF